jgi:hypothetical protein
LIFDEKSEAENLLSNGFSSFMSYKDLCILAKYFKYIGKNEAQIRRSLIGFCVKYNPEFNEILSRERINKAIINSKKYGIKLPININITESELLTIKNSGDHKRQKILFIALAIAKYMKYNNTRYVPKNSSIYDDNFYANISLTDILKMAKVNIGKAERVKIFSEFHDLGLISSTYVGYPRILFVDENSPVKIIITDMKNCIDFCPLYCDICGEIIKNVSKKHNLCEKCYEERRRESIRNNVRNYRNKEM